MIMSYPVLTKLKTLSSITPTLASPGPNSPTFEVRGTVIAIEGLDQARVFDMTQSLAEQLEKEGKFAVRIFTGPDPYLALQTSRRASVGEKGGEFMTAAKYLSLMSKWHKVSKDLVDFTTQRPRVGMVKDATDQDVIEVAAPQALGQQKMSPFESEQNKSHRSPISAVSPGTIKQTADMSIDTRVAAIPAWKIKDNNPATPLASARITRSRVPAWLKDNQSGSEETQPPFENQASVISSSSIPPPPSSQPPTTPPPPPSASPSPKTKPPSTSISLPQISSKIPIALVPHYQLTTVDTCSIALPITDNYDPLTHWRWHATLWRGCVGPDISIVIKSLHEQHEDDANPTHPTTTANTTTTTAPTSTDAQKRPSNTNLHPGNSITNPPPPATLRSSDAQQGTAGPVAQDSTAPKPPPFGVEVRLQDHRAVIVRAALGARHGSGANGSSITDAEREKENEHWEKAKRRVGFEVEECLRR